MANLEAIIAEKSQQDNQWRAEMQADRENTIAMQDAGVEEITSSPELYVKYLDSKGIQCLFPRFVGSPYTPDLWLLEHLELMQFLSLRQLQAHTLL